VVAPYVPKKEELENNTFFEKDCIEKDPVESYTESMKKVQD